MRITTLERRRGQKRITIRFDEGTDVLVGTEVCVQYGLRPGVDLTDSQLTEILHAEAHRDCLESAVRLLSYRQRTEAELRDRLLKKKMSAEVVAETIERLLSAGLLDDTQFARNWVETRDQRAPRSRRLIAQELRARGVARPVIERETAALDENHAAYRAAERRAQTLSGSSYADFRQRIGGLLLRRGFGYETVRETVHRLWLDVKGEQGQGE
jgi:regulatory protein